MIALEADVEGQVGSMRIRAALRAADGPLVLVGPNGAGKTSLLSMILGALTPTRGRITLGDDVLYDSAAAVDVPVEGRRLGYVPQDYGLFPHLSVDQNVRFAVESSPVSADRRERGRRAEALIGELGLEAFAGRSVTTLSGGERQRVALARALAAQPRALLLDEPLAALDVHARRDVRAFLARYLEALALPTIVITHDPEDARALGRRVVVMERGERVQAGTWAELAARPSTPFVEALART